MSESLAGLSGDLSVSLPSDTTTFSAVGMLPVGRLDVCHALVLADDVAVEEVEALALSLDEHAGWVGVSRLQLMPGAELQGPWPLDAELRRLLGLPDWAASIMILETPTVRGGPLPEALAGLDPVADAFPLAQPEGSELLVLTRLRSIARRLAGALLLQGDAGTDGRGRMTRRSVLVQPDPATAVNLDVYAPVWLAPDAAEALVAPLAPGMRHQLAEPVPGAPIGLAAMDPQELERLTERLGADVLDRAWKAAEERHAQMLIEAEQVAAEGGVLEPVLDGYALTGPVDPAQSTMGLVELRVGGTELLPLAVSGAPWAETGGAVYSLVWVPQNSRDRDPQRISEEGRRGRAAATELIERLAGAVAEATGGVILDEDGFLVAL
ncbi:MULTISPECIES: hypothetical protein [Actinomyces]|uniref:Uncharacterized protein n=1 Tax=Actinomyces respiraculi TaxID=2744574 RepID=A0A7T0LKN8_9ACTO|nr:MULTISPECIES: hypothetical protein [Actinomyces]QPL05201.1 hypothetical protein ID810_10820 [Actinomyces respiraculi]